MSDEKQMTFWDHLDVMRGGVLRSASVWAVFSIVAFVMKDWLFWVVFAPSRADFILYKVLGVGDFDVKFINTDLTAQFIVHLEVAMLAGLVVAMPYIVIEAYRFIAPALYDNERRVSAGVTAGGVLLFVTGALLNYFVIFPFAFRFLSLYQVNDVVVNQISLRSYVSTLMVMTIMIGVLFEMPVVAWILGKVGLINADGMRKYRRYAIVALLILAAVITPTGDAVTLMLVAVPLYALYELSILLVRSPKTKDSTT